MTGTVLAIISDTHIGSSTALATPEFEVHSRYDIEAQITRYNRLQEWLYKCWLDFWAYVYERQGKGRKAKRLIVVHCGDVLDGVHHESTQLMPEIADQMKMAYELLEPVVHRANGFYGILGTPAHAGVDHAHETALYDQLGADAVGYQLTLDIDGITFDFAHHGRAGGRPWTSAGANVATEVAIDYATRGKPLPNYIIRGHRHIIDDSGLKIPGMRAISLPSWQLRTSYGHRVSPTVRSDIGGLIFVDGVLDDSKMRYKGQPDERRIIKI